MLALGTLLSHMKSGAMKGILTSNKIPEYPEIPTLPELGYRQKPLWCLARLLCTSRSAGRGNESTGSRR